MQEGKERSKAARLRFKPRLLEVFNGNYGRPQLASDVMAGVTVGMIALPLALATGAGAESRQQIGWVIVGGMSVGTLLTIFVVPTIYTLLARKSMPGEITTPAL